MAIQSNHVPSKYQVSFESSFSDALKPVGKTQRATLKAYRFRIQKIVTDYIVWGTPKSILLFPVIGVIGVAITIFEAISKMSIVLLGEDVDDAALRYGKDYSINPSQTSERLVVGYETFCKSTPLAILPEL